MRLHAVLPLIQRHPAFTDLIERLRAATASTLAGAAVRAPGPAAAAAGGPEPPQLSVLDAAKPAAVAALHAALGRPMLLVTARPNEARSVHRELLAWSVAPENVLLFPETDALPYERLAPDPERLAERLTVLARLAAAGGNGAGPSAAGPPLVIASVRALLDLLMPPEAFRAGLFTVRVGDRLQPQALIERLLAVGYEPAPLADTPGTFARRGGILDVYPPAAGRPGEAPGPFRVEFWGDDVESIRRFDPATQRSTERTDAATVIPAHEVQPADPSAPLSELDLAAVRESERGQVERELQLLRSGQAFPTLEYYRGWLGSATLAEYLPDDGLVALDEPAQLEQVAAEFERQAEELQADLLLRGEIPPALPRPYRSPGTAGAPLATIGRSRADRLVGARPGTSLLVLSHDPDAETVPFVHPPAFGGRLRQLLDRLAGPTGAAGDGAADSGPGPRLAIVVSQQSSRLAELFAERGRPVAPLAEVPADVLAIADGRPPTEPAAPPSVVLVHGTLRSGWRSDALGVTVLSDNEIFGLSKVPRPVARPRAAAAAREALLADLQPGDLVVHVDHGIGRYQGLVRLPLDPADPAAGEREFLLLDYAENDRLYVPADQADRVTRYVGAGNAAPTLTRLGSGEWQRAKQRVRRAVRDIARDLVELYASRQLVEGFAFSPDTPWQQELEASFPFVETPDQLEAIKAVKSDLERPRPMDRLLVGDVGYGKTEVALRAAFKAVVDGKQVAVLVPTTVLAQQHFNTFRERLGAFPVRVEMLSRFRSEREQREIVAALRSGRIDVVIGTHRLIQKDVEFKDLGLVIIDEEQRFGVAHKERLKQLRREVDVLTLTATPIPRTLYMALSDVRDLSTIETPPEERRPIRTVVAEYDEGLVREAIVRELDRGGQVYFVHNRVQNIEFVANRVRRLLPEASVAVGHGQMPEEQLERVMLDFAAGQHDVLVCTTIIESGLDIPNANTIIINNAHRFGLAQLYQLRGRVGRGAQRAYAYLLYPRDVQLGEAAEQRLRTIFEATELGAGFRIALKDLEIRGAGNLLGAEQHGHISAVGFDLYTHLLGEAVDQLRTVLRPGEGGMRAGEGRRPRVFAPSAAQPQLDLPLEDAIPADYVPDEAQRLNLYQRLAAVTSGEQLGELVAELEDRFGPLPPSVQNRVYALGLRLAAARAGVEEIVAADGELIVRFARLPRLDLDRLVRQVGVPVRAGSNQLRIARGSGQGWMARLLALVEALPPASA